ncbi:MAG: GDPmannose 4,6-dehydratase [Parcubacteria bacterium C7867-001]|nr:MAG: GDPmannose 4,6-dehydratase [Parcubacteria bacterium C7867-001]
MAKRALITGVTGQDGAYLAKLLVEKGYKVYGGYRRTSTRNFWRLHYLDVKKDIELIPMDLIDQTSILMALRKSDPHEVYNLAAQSFVGASFDEAISTGEISGLGVTRMLDSVRFYNPSIRFYQASTSEMYGATPPPHNEDSMFRPQSPYAAAKLYGHWVTGNYRTGYKMHASSGILFNHESPIRGVDFVTKKITDTVARIKMGYSKELNLGNLDAHRDWGFAGDYVEAMWLMLQQSQGDDYVVATGECHSVREFCEAAFSRVGLNYRDYVKVKDEFKRPLEVPSLLGDATKAREKLGWKPKVTFGELVQMMVDADMEKYQNPTKHSEQFLKHM